MKQKTVEIEVCPYPGMLQGLLLLAWERAHVAQNQRAAWSDVANRLHAWALLQDVRSEVYAELVLLVAIAEQHVDTALHCPFGERGSK